MSLLDIRDLRVVYPNGLEALKSISLSAEKGEIIAIIGRSGAGKSTLLRCINGLQRPSSGTITLDGEDITQLDEAGLRNARCHIGFIWQEYNLIDRLPVITNVLAGRLGYNQGAQSLFGYFSRRHREVAVRSLERVGLLDRAHQRADMLSGGEKQRIAIARAISQEPKVVLADEPVASLDPELSVQVMADLARVAREDQVLTIINIHQVSLATEFADRIIGIAQGQVVFDGVPSQLNDQVLNQVYRFDRQASTASAGEPVHA
ncbi:MAG: phosphonate ABC transporter ATP-binding protein [Roseiflexaceae bacterium]|nr:phosphonate ABC transporter ATP-binding protein [Roseiflexaceae bacterium]